MTSPRKHADRDEQDRVDRLLEYVGAANVALALLLAVAALAVTFPLELLSGPQLGTAVFTLLLGLIVLAARRLGRRRSRPSTGWS